MDIISSGMTSVASITVICFVLAQTFKAIGLNTKWLPVGCMILGGILGGIFWKVTPGYPAQDVLTAIAVGIVSGLAATGAHQIYKQAEK